MRAKRWIGTALLLAAWPQAAAAGTGFEAGGGMEYFTMSSYSRDAAGNYFQSLLQTTLAVARLGYTAGPLRLEVAAGLSDWNVSGEWSGTGFERLSLDDYYTWAFQQHFQAEAAWEALPDWELLLGYFDRRVRHYNGNLQDTFLDVRLRNWNLGLQYTVLKTSSVRLRAAARYAPRAEVTWYQDIATELPLDVQGPVDASETGWDASGRLQFQYRDTAGWGIDIGYVVGVARFDHPRDLSEIALRYGALTGYFTLLF
jgi:hypothetical protein